MIEVSKKEIDDIIESANKKRLASINIKELNKQAEEVLGN